jgi:hypothetical protein
MLSPKEIQDEECWKDIWEFTIRYQNLKKGKTMYTFIVGESQPESMQGVWQVTETIAGDADKVLVKASKDGIDKKMWVKRTDLVPAENVVVSDAPDAPDANTEENPT